MPPQDVLRLRDSTARSDLAFGKFSSFLRTQGEVRLGPARSNEQHVSRLELHPRVLGASPEHVQGDGRRLVEMGDWWQTVTFKIERDVEQVCSGGDGFASVVWTMSTRNSSLGYISQRGNRRTLDPVLCDRLVLGVIGAHASKVGERSLGRVVLVRIMSEPVPLGRGLGVERHVIVIAVTPVYAACVSNISTRSRLQTWPSASRVPLTSRGRMERGLDSAARRTWEDWRGQRRVMREVSW
jgi:hypothetical protein